MVHVADGGTAEARALAASLPADPDHELVVADLPSDSPAEVWESFATALPKGRRPIRLVPGRHPREIGPHVGQWLSERTGRAVLAPYGLTHQGAAGSLFVHSRASSGWGYFRQGQPPKWEAKRFPRPAWDSPAVAEVRKAGAGSVAEPLPAGMWIRPGGADDWFAAGRAKLTRTLPCQPDVPVIVLGAPGVADLELADVAAFWWTLPADVRAKARFVRFGGVALPEGTALGQAVADVLEVEVRCYTGIPVGSPDAPDVFAPRSDGSHGWSTFAQDAPVKEPADIALPLLSRLMETLAVPVSDLPPRSKDSPTEPGAEAPANAASVSAFEEEPEHDRDWPVPNPARLPAGRNQG